MICSIITLLILHMCVSDVMATSSKCYSCHHTNWPTPSGDDDCYENFQSSTSDCSDDQICAVTSLYVTASRIWYSVTRECKNRIECYHGCYQGYDSEIKDNQICTSCCDGDLCNDDGGADAVTFNLLTLAVTLGVAFKVLL